MARVRHYMPSTHRWQPERLNRGSACSLPTSSRNRIARRSKVPQQRIASADARNVKRLNARGSALAPSACNISAHHDMRANASFSASFRFKVLTADLSALHW